MKKIAFNSIVLMCILSWSIRLSAQSFSPQNSPKYETRAVWLTTLNGIDWPRSHAMLTQQEELRQILDRLKKAGINTVFFQTRVRGTVTYPSAFEPWDGCLTGKPGIAPNYDPLQFAIDECHRRGIQLHAWVVTIPIGKWNKIGCSQLRKKQPKLVKKIGDDGFLSPEAPETADYLARICREIVANYDVDGIHLDYIRYPETWKGRTPKTQGRANITRIVRAIHREVKSLKPWVMLSCSPIGKHDDLLRYRSYGWNARTTVCQDAQQWLHEGIMDALFPMMYFRDNQFFPFAIDWQEHSYGRVVAPGLGIYFLDPREGKWTLGDVERQMHVLRQLGMGHCFFRTKFLLDNVKGIYDFVVRFNTVPALVPPMKWQSTELPETPEIIGIGNDGRLRWLIKNADSSTLTYNVYASEKFPVDINNPANIVITNTSLKELIIDANFTGNYAVTSVDRYGNESRPAQLQLRGSSDESDKIDLSKILKADQFLALPPKPSTVDAPYVIFETILGQPVTVQPYGNHYYDVSELPDGFYQWRTLNEKGRSHRMGFFSIKHQSATCPSSK